MGLSPRPVSQSQVTPAQTSCRQPLPSLRLSFVVTWPGRPATLLGLSRHQENLFALCRAQNQVFCYSHMKSPIRMEKAAVWLFL